MKKKFLIGLTAICMGIASIGLSADMVMTVQAAEETTFDDFNYVVLEDGTVEISKYTGSETEVIIPEKIDGKKVTSIGDFAFYNCTSLSKIDLPKGMTSVGGSAFRECTSLSELSLPEGLTSIGAYAFCDCTSLSEIDLPEGLTSIGNCTFYNCISLSELSLPEGLTSIGDSAFNNCTSLSALSLPEGLTSIGDSVFNNCTSLSALSLPESITFIGGYAFYNCISLSELSLPESITIIGPSAFNNCTSLSEIRLPQKVGTIGIEALGYIWNSDTGEREKVDNFMILGYAGTAAQVYAFREGFVFESLGGESFSYEDFECFEMENGEIKILYYFGSEDSIIVPSEINEKKVTSIGNDAFYGCTNLVKVELPKSLTSIGSGAFEGCTSLSKISLPEGLTSIEEYAFYGCENLTTVELPEGLTSIGDSAFYQCLNLRDINFPEGLTSIGEGAFFGCSYLSKITIPESIVDIGDYALGYQINDDTPEYGKVEGFKIIGYAGTAAETYALENGFTFEEAGPLELKITATATDCYVYVGDKVTFTGTASGGSQSYMYSYLVYNKETGTWARLTPSYVQENSFTWTAGSAGKRVFYVEVKDSLGQIVRSSGIDVQVMRPLAITAEADTDTVALGNKVVITGNATGGSESYTYSFLVYNRATKTWARLTPKFTEKNTFTWTAGSAGTRDFYVEVKDSLGTVVRSKAVTVATKSNALEISAKASASKAKKGEKVILTGTASGGEGTYTYSYLVYNRTTKTWARLTPKFTSSNTFTWTAGSAGIRDFYVEVKDSTGKVVRSKVVTVTVTEETEELKVTGKASASSVTTGTKVTLTASAAGGKGDYTYSYLVYNVATKTWARLTPKFTSNNTFTWTAGSAGLRRFYVEAKDNTGKVVRSSAVAVTVK